MIVVSGVIEIAQADIEAAKAATITMMHETAKEAGCLVYRFAQDLEFPAHHPLNAARHPWGLARGSMGASGSFTLVTCAAVGLSFNI